jgi:GT2 family glycosyltransferase
MPTLSVCLVNWNTRDLLAECLSSLQAHAADLAPQIVVADNASADGSAAMVQERFPGVTLIANAENRGYAAATNQALQAAPAGYRLLLNPDVAVTPGSVQALAAFLAKHPRTGAVAPQLTYPDGRVQASCRGFPTPLTVLLDMLDWSRRFAKLRALREYRLEGWGHDTERQVDQPMASALLLRGAALEQVGLLDEGCPIFFNDVDLCYRLGQAGWEIWFTPAARMVHHSGSSIAQVAPQRRLEMWYAGWVHYYRKHFRRRVNPLVFWATRALLATAFGAQWLRIVLRPGARMRRLLGR